MPFGREIVGVGVDLVSLKRIERFLAENPTEAIQRLLAPSEQKIFKSSSRPVEFFARCFAAKEAYFKARGDSWREEEDWWKVEITIHEKNKFIIPSDFQAEGEFFESPDGVGARVLIASTLRASQ